MIGKLSAGAFFVYKGNFRLNIQIRTKEFVNDFDKYTHNNPEKMKKLDRNAAKMQKTDHN